MQWFNSDSSYTKIEASAKEKEVTGKSFHYAGWLLLLC